MGNGGRPDLDNGAGTFAAAAGFSSRAWGQGAELCRTEVRDESSGDEHQVPAGPL